MTFIAALKSGRKFRPAGSQKFYDRAEVSLISEGISVKMVSILELQAADWEIEEPVARVAQSDLVKAITKAATSASLSQLQIDALTAQLKTNLNLDGA